MYIYIYLYIRNCAFKLFRSEIIQISSIFAIYMCMTYIYITLCIFGGSDPKISKSHVRWNPRMTDDHFTVSPLSYGFISHLYRYTLIYMRYQVSIAARRHYCTNALIEVMCVLFSVPDFDILLARIAQLHAQPSLQYQDHRTVSVSAYTELRGPTEPTTT